MPEIQITALDGPGADWAHLTVSGTSGVVPVVPGKHMASLMCPDGKRQQERVLSSSRCLLEYFWMKKRQEGYWKVSGPVLAFTRP